MRILFAASECFPFVKTGGLADVLGALPSAVARLSNRLEPVECVVFLPKYSQIQESQFPMRKLPGRLLIPMGDRIEEGSVWELERSGKPKALYSDKLPKNLSIYFVENKRYFNRSGIYQPADGFFDDNDERYIFFSRAVLEGAKFLDFVPDVIHAHDWQTGLIPAYLKTSYRTDAFFHKTATVFTIHNIAYQGNFHKQAVYTAGLEWKEFSPDKLEFYDQISFLKAGIVYSSKVNTVSPNYCRETQSGPDFGFGMEGVLKNRAGDYTGILNGLDYSEWNPRNDVYLAQKFTPTAKDLTARKKLCKADLQKEVKLSVDESIPLIGMVSRLDPQKGFSVILEILPKMLEEGVKAQWVFLGSGDKTIKDTLFQIAKKYPKSVAAQFSFNNPLAHKIYAGADLFLMPSEFEPCGLSQMIAMAYGSVPVATPTGGLLDTVQPWDSQRRQGTGFMAEERSSAPALRKALDQALETWSDSARWESLVRSVMDEDFSWDSSARDYLALYQAASKTIPSA